VSTKIYDAWRFPSPRLNDYLDWARSQVRTAIKERVEGLMEALKPEVIEGFGECPDHFKGGGEAIWERHKRMTYIMDCCREAAQTSHRDTLFDIEFGLNLWLHRGFFYVITIGEHWMAATLRDPPQHWVQEYHYQNQSDPPEDISPEDWDERRINWEAVCGGTPNSYNDRLLFFEIQAAKTSLDTFDLESSIAGHDLRLLLDTTRRSGKP